MHLYAAALSSCVAGNDFIYFYSGQPTFVQGFAELAHRSPLPSMSQSDANANANPPPSSQAVLTRFEWICERVRSFSFPPRQYIRI